MFPAYFVHSFPPIDPTQSAPELTAGGVISVLMVYIFTFAFGVSLGPISWNVASEVNIHRKLAFDVKMLTARPDLSPAHQRNMLRHHNLHTMAIPRRRGDVNPIPPSFLRLDHIVSPPASKTPSKRNSNTTIQHRLRNLLHPHAHMGDFLRPRDQGSAPWPTDG